MNSCKFVPFVANSTFQSMLNIDFNLDKWIEKKGTKCGHFDNLA
jgi:hypothetical protein